MSNRRSLKKAAFLGSAELPDLLPGGSAVAGEAGAKSGQSGQYAPPVKAEGNRPPAGQVLAPAASHAARTKEHGKGRHAAIAPGQCVASEREMRGRLALAAARRQPELHRLGLTDREFLQIYSAVSDARNWTIKAIHKGLCVEQDLRASDGLWIKLESIMIARMNYGGQS